MSLEIVPQETLVAAEPTFVTFILRGNLSRREMLKILGAGSFAAALSLYPDFATSTFAQDDSFRSLLRESAVLRHTDEENLTGGSLTVNFPPGIFELLSPDPVALTYSVGVDNFLFLINRTLEGEIETDFGLYRNKQLGAHRPIDFVRTFSSVNNLEGNPLVARWREGIFQYVRLNDEDQPFERMYVRGRPGFDQPPSPPRIPRLKRGYTA